MAVANIGQIVADTWDHMLRVSEDPFRDHSGLFDEMFGRPRRTYRQILHRDIINAYGETVPRIELVRENLRRLGKTRLNPSRIP